MTGKWSQPNVPHRGWNCISVEDLGSPDEICEMCETQEIRYVHFMKHPDYERVLGVGCVCAERMEEDYVRPKRRENELRNAAGRKRRWLARKWRISAKGNAYLNVDGINITVFQKRDGTWGGRLQNRMSGRKVDSQRIYASEDEAKLAAFDAMIFMKSKHGWGS